MRQYILFQQDTPVPPPQQPAMTPPPPPPSSAPQTGGSASGMAITALVIGIASFFICWFIGGIAAWIIGKIEVNKIERGESPEAGKSMAKIGMWLGIINVIISILGIIIYIAIIVIALLTSSHS
jgi:hypothetical protein